MKILRGIEKLAVDANPILSAIIGGNACRVFGHADNTAFYTTLFNYREVEKYIPVLSSKRNISLEDLYLALSMLPLSVYDEDFYKDKIRQAKNMIAKKDPDDAHLLALALELNCPIWSNDRDFEGLKIKLYTTLDLIAE
ncbi:MAG: PIN domain nuclease [Deltaproteobacteria bacterium]|nr:PIN domain nuclease [Deltaproteobacteria bacterium]